MAGTVTVTSMSNPYAQGGENKVVVDWLSAAGGNADGALCSTFAAAQLATYGYASPQPSKFRGKLVKVETSPGTNGAKAAALPTAGYDITLTTSYGTDVTDNYLADRSGTLSEDWVPVTPVAVDDDLTLNIANAGAAARGRVILHFE